MKGYIFARFNGLGPFFSIEDCNVVDLCVEFLYLWVRRGRRAEGISFNKESFDGFREVRYHVRDVTLGDVMLCGGVQDIP